MKAKLQTINIGGRTFVTGYMGSSDGADISDTLTSVAFPDLDQYGNPSWELVDGAVVPVTITPTAEQVKKKSDDADGDKVSVAFFKAVVKAIKSTADAGESWKAIDSALRDALR